MAELNMVSYKLQDLQFFNKLRAVQSVVKEFSGNNGEQTMFGDGQPLFRCKGGRVGCAKLFCEKYIECGDEDQRIYRPLRAETGMPYSVVVWVRGGEMYAVSPVNRRKMMGKYCHDFIPETHVCFCEEQIKPRPPHVIRRDGIVISQHVRAAANQRRTVL